MPACRMLRSPHPDMVWQCRQSEPGAPERSDQVDASLDLGIHVPSAWRTLDSMQFQGMTTAALSPAVLPVPPPGWRTASMVAPAEASAAADEHSALSRSHSRATASESADDEDSAVLHVRRHRGSACAESPDASGLDHDADAALALPMGAHISPKSSEASNSGSSNLAHSDAPGTPASAAGSGVWMGAHADTAYSAGAPVDTPDRALLAMAAAPLATPEPSPSITLATCGFATSTLDATPARPSPMLNSPPGAGAKHERLQPSAADAGSPEPLLPKMSEAPNMPRSSDDRWRSGTGAGRLPRARSRAAAMALAAPARESVAHVQFCRQSQARAAAAAPERGQQRLDGAPENHDAAADAAAFMTEHREIEQIGAAAHAPESTELDRPEVCASLDLAQQCGRLRARTEPVQDATPRELAVRGSYCTAYKETWREAMAAYAAAKHKRALSGSSQRAFKHAAAATAAASTPPPAQQAYKPFSPSLLHVEPPEISHQSPPVPPTAPAPSPADSAHGYARTLPLYVATPARMSSAQSASGALVSPSPKPKRLSALWGNSGLAQRRSATSNTLQAAGSTEPAAKGSGKASVLQQEDSRATGVSVAGLTEASCVLAGDGKAKRSKRVKTWCSSKLGKMFRKSSADKH